MTTAGQTSVTSEHLRSFVARIERLEEEKKALAEDIKEVYAEANGEGFDTKAMRLVIRLRKQNEADLHEQEELLDVYKRALAIAPGVED